MSQFHYRAFTKSGGLVEGMLEAAAEREVLVSLRRQNLKVLLIEEKAASWTEMLGGLRRKKIHPQEVMRFTSMFSTLVNAGIPLSTCMRTLHEQADNAAFKEVLMNVMQEIESGMDLSQALARHPAVFDRMYTDLVRAGESAGALDVVLERLAAYAEKADKFRRKIKSALTYPVVVLAIAVLIVWIILVFVVPEFAATFAQAGKQLPLPTRMLMAMSNIMRDWYMLIAAGIGAFIWGLKMALKDPRFQRKFDGFILKVPVYGELMMKSAMARFSRTMSMLLVSGVPIIQALQIVSHVTGNRLITEALLSVSDSISGGDSFTDPLKRSGIFSPLVVQMISVGETTGNMSGMLTKIADFYEDEVEMVMDTLSSLIEPIMIVFLGVVLGFVIIALFLPILSLSEIVPV